MPEREDFGDENGFEFQPGVEVEADPGFFGEDFAATDETPVDGPVVQSGPAFTDTDDVAASGSPGKAQVGGPDQGEIKPERERTLRPVPNPKVYKFKDGNSPTTRAQRLAYTRLCKKLGIPFDIALQTILLFYNTKDLISARIQELEFIIAFEELIDTYPENTTDILRILHLKTHRMHKDATDNFKDIHNSIEEVKKITGISEDLRSPPDSVDEPVSPPSGFIVRTIRILLRKLRLLPGKRATSGKV